MNYKISRNRSSERGQSLIEFALVLPLIILLVGGVFEFGLLFMTNHLVQNASREGARLAVVLPNLIDDDPRVIDTVDELIPDSGIFTIFAGGITNNGISDCDTNDQVTVTVTGTYSFGILQIIGLSDVVLNVPTTMRYEGC